MTSVVLGVQGWSSGDSTRFSPMWAGFDSQTRRRMWVRFAGSLPCIERFFSRYSGLPSPQKLTFDLICVNCWFQLTVSPISAPALEHKTLTRAQTSFKAFNKLYFLEVLNLPNFFPSWLCYDAIWNTDRSLTRCIHYCEVTGYHGSKRAFWKQPIFCL